MNLIKLQTVKNILKDLDSRYKMHRVPLSNDGDTCLRIFHHSQERNLYLVSLHHQSKTLNKNKDKNIKFFISLVGQDVYDYLEGLVASDRERHYNKGSGIGYLGLSVKQLETLLVLMYDKVVKHSVL